MADVHAYSKLAAELSTSFTVISAERRGRGPTPRPYDSTRDIARDVEDHGAILEATGARTRFGLSSGAVLTLEATRTLDRVERAVVYEPLGWVAALAGAMVLGGLPTKVAANTAVR
jgi:hypothetical protein